MKEIKRIKSKIDKRFTSDSARIFLIKKALNL